MTTKSNYLICQDPDTYENPAVVSSNQTISYIQLRNAIELCVVHLKKIGINADDHVGIISPNSIEYIVVLLSLWSIKAVACPLNIQLPERALKNQLQLINCQHLLTSIGKFNTVNIKQNGLSRIARVQDFKTDCHPRENGDPGISRMDSRFRGNDMWTRGLRFNALEQKSTILFTSGSRSGPKPVLHTLGNHIFSAIGSNEMIPVVPGDHWLLSLPLYHVSGLSIIFRVLRMGGTIVIPEPHENIKQAIGQLNITHVSLVPTQLARLFTNNEIIIKLRNLKVILIGGSSIPNALLQSSLKNKLPIYTTYGLTEMASQVATAKYPMSVQILNHRNAKISNDGEILVKGNTLFQGYIDGDKIHLPLTKDGWFATGDLGFLKDDGGLIVTGRKDNMFISGGENIQPEEIEQHLCQLECIEQAVVVPLQNDEFGFRPVVFIKMVGDQSIHREELYRFLENHLPKFKIPDQFYVWPDISASSDFKINRRNILQWALEKNRSIKQIN